MKQPTIGAQLIADERQKQIDKHGFTAQHHVNHPEWYENGQLKRAARSLLLNPLSIHVETPENWDEVWFKDLSNRTDKERLIIAGALIAAELDRLNEIDNDLEECIGCTKKWDVEEMMQDDAGENYCQDCWEEMSPIMKAEYEQMVKNGEIEPNE